MKQSRLGSFGESVINTAAGFGLSLLCQWLILPLLGVSISLTQNLAFAVIMTVVSVGRQYVLRRVFEYFRISRQLSAGMTAVIAERFRQVEVEGWSPHHDRAHEVGELARAGAAYAQWAVANINGDLVLLAAWRDNRSAPGAPPCWPWDSAWWKPAAADYRRNLVRAGALIVAELDRHDRNRRPA